MPTTNSSSLTTLLLCLANISPGSNVTSLPTDLVHLVLLLAVPRRRHPPECRLDPPLVSPRHSHQHLLVLLRVLFLLLSQALVNRYNRRLLLLLHPQLPSFQFNSLKDLVLLYLQVYSYPSRRCR